jgi:3-dehydroquinate synthetase
VDALRALRPGPTETAIRRCMELKAVVVGQDERESDRRAILNYGHTVGHAVAIGLVAAARIAVELGLLGADVAARQRALLERFDLPTNAPGVDRAAVRAAMGLDKKARAGQLAWVLPTRLGDVTVRRDVPEALVERALDEVLTA